MAAHPEPGSAFTFTFHLADAFLQSDVHMSLIHHKQGSSQETTATPNAKLQQSNRLLIEAGRTLNVCTRCRSETSISEVNKRCCFFSYKWRTLIIQVVKNITVFTKTLSHMPVNSQK